MSWTAPGQGYFKEDAAAAAELKAKQATEVERLRR